MVYIVVLPVRATTKARLCETSRQGRNLLVGGGEECETWVGAGLAWAGYRYLRDWAVGNMDLRCGNGVKEVCIGRMGRFSLKSVDDK